MLADELNLKRETVRKILTDDLSMKKLCATMVPKNLLAEQKHVQMSISQDCLEQVEADSTLLDRVITGDESWYFQYDPERKRQSQQWLSPGAARPKKARMSNVSRFLTSKNIAVLPQAPYSPDMSPCDFFLFPQTKLAMKGTHFESITDIQNAVTRVLQDIPVEAFQKCYESWKKPSSSSVTTNTPQLHNNKKTKLFKTTNRYQILSQDIDPGPDPPLSPNLDNDGHNDVFKPPPPIFVRGVTNYSNLTTAFIELIGVDNFFCKASADRLKIQTANPESYRSLIHFLKDEGAEYHTYQLKEDKPLRVVIRNLHHTTEPDTIKEELEVRMFDVRRVTNVLHRVTKAPLPLFFVDLEPQIKSNEIFQLTSLLHTKIRVEEPYKSKILSQCINCQEYGHTKTYCGYPPRCVRCGAGHKTPDCPNQRSDPPKCALCSGNHPASYKGCSIYKDLQRVKKPFTKSNFVSTNTKTNFSNVKDSRPSNDTHLNQSNTHFPTYAQATSGRPVNNAASETTPDLNNTITRFLEEFKSLLNPLMSLLTTVIDKLLTKL
ncbi:hypothetical protein QTP88_018708 [Uroleucon formosanum]